MRSHHLFGFFFIFWGLVACNQSVRPIKPFRPSPTAPLDAIVLSAPQSVTFAEIAADPPSFLNRPILVSGNYLPLTPEPCDTTLKGPALRWALVADSLQMFAMGYDSLVELVPSGTPMTVQGVWRLYQGPNGCGKEPAVKNVWYIEIEQIVAPNPISKGVEIVNNPNGETVQQEPVATLDPNLAVPTSAPVDPTPDPFLTPDLTPDSSSGSADFPTMEPTFTPFIPPTPASLPTLPPVPNIIEPTPLPPFEVPTLPPLYPPPTSESATTAPPEQLPTEAVIPEVTPTPEQLPEVTPTDEASEEEVTTSPTATVRNSTPTPSPSASPTLNETRGSTTSTTTSTPPLTATASPTVDALATTASTGTPLPSDTPALPTATLDPQASPLPSSTPNPVPSPLPNSPSL